MMKKLLLLGSAIFIMSLGVKSQTKAYSPVLKTAVVTPTLVIDTVHYYLNKYYFKSGNSTFTTYPYYRNDASALTTFTDITFCGSRFDVPLGDTVAITGLEAFVSKEQTTVHLTIPIHIYLCKLDPNTGLPVLPAIDSVVTAIGGSGSFPMPQLIGGNFTGTTNIAARTMTTSYAVLVRNFSGSSGDFTHFLRTPCKTETNTAAPLNEKYSDSYGFVRFNGKFYSTKDFNGTLGFGPGTDYEFMVAPRVAYTIHAGQIAPAGVSTAASPSTPDTMCTRTTLVFTNASSPFYEHRQYNLQQFYRKWNLGSPFPQSVVNAFSSDSSITWHFEFYDIEQPARDSRVFLPYVNSSTISAQTGISYYPDCFTANQFRARLKPMAAFGRVAQLFYNEDFITCFRYCNGDTVGIKSIAGFPDLKVYPNPAVNGKSMISGLEGKTTLIVYDILGQIISSEATDKSTFEVDLTKRPKGTYVVKLVNASNQAKTVKIINN